MSAHSEEAKNVPLIPVGRESFSKDYALVPSLTEEELASLGKPNGFTVEDVKQIKEEKKQKILETFKDWKIFGSNVNPNYLFKREVVAILIGNPANSAKFVQTKIEDACQKLQNRIAVLYVPNNVTDMETERRYQASLPRNWIVITHPDVVINSVRNALGTIEDLHLFFLSGDSKKLLVDDISEVVYGEAHLIGHGDKIYEGPALKHLVSFELVGVFFGASHNEKCRKFTPKLIKHYHRLKDAGKKIEIVYISGDRDFNSFSDFFAEMPWPAIDYNQHEVARVIAMMFEASRVPYLCWVNVMSGEIIPDGLLTVKMPIHLYPYTREKMEIGRKLVHEARLRKWVDYGACTPGTTCSIS